MGFHPLDLIEPEETVGNLWHDYARQIDTTPAFESAAVRLDEVRPSVVVLFRALGGAAETEIGEAPAVRSGHRLRVARKLGTAEEMLHLARFDGERLGLPPVIDAFPVAALNRGAFLWLAAMSAFAEVPARSGDPVADDLAQIAAVGCATLKARSACPGLRQIHAEMCRFLLDTRRRPALPAVEALVEDAVVRLLRGETAEASPGSPADRAPRGYRTFAPVPIWPLLGKHTAETLPRADSEETQSAPPAATTSRRKLAARKNRDEANRRDSFIIHRFEAILSWVESMNLNRMVDDDDDENAAKAADDQDEITLSRHDRRAATRLRMHLDLSPEDARHERLAEGLTYPEWDCRSRSYLPDHCRVLEVEAATDAPGALTPDPRHLRRVRRQFEMLHPRRILHPRQVDGTELDLDAVVAARAEMRANGRCTDRIYQTSRQTERDLSVAVLLDVSRSTEAFVEETSVLDVARQSLAALAGGIDAAGDRLGIWAFSSLRRDRVFVSRCKAFDERMSPEVTSRICGLRPGHYTRLGAAVRHVSARLSAESATRKLLLVLTDGKPNDLDHYEGLHGIEDSHMAVREARRAGQSVHGVIIDADGQDWFARIFGRGHFTLLPNPARLPQALPRLYRSLTEETR